MAASSSSALEVAVLAGGRSSEHDISLSSGAAVSEGLQAAGHTVVWVEIGRDGVWRREGEPLALAPAAGLLGVDVVFPALHGPFGEDGTVQGLLETLDVPYVGSGVTASALCLDKVLFKQVMAAAEVPQVDFLGVRAERFERDQQAVLNELFALGLPVFVKPAHLGSSLGIVKVTSSSELVPALHSAFAYDELVIVEAMARGIEVECSVLGWAGDGPMASMPGHVVPAGEWYDFAAKYEPGGMELHVPADIGAAATERVQDIARSAFLAAGCDGLARVDFFVDGERVLLNELNTMPGFTPTSVYAKLMQASGVAYPELVERLCRLALARHARRSAYRF
jgi:D-alanine-D-alanine ligase